MSIADMAAITRRCDIQRPFLSFIAASADATPDIFFFRFEYELPYAVMPLMLRAFSFDFSHRYAAHVISRFRLPAIMNIVVYYLAMQRASAAAATARCPSYGASIMFSPYFLRQRQGIFS